MTANHLTQNVSWQLIHNMATVGGVNCHKQQTTNLLTSAVDIWLVAGDVAAHKEALPSLCIRSDLPAQKKNDKTKNICHLLTTTILYLRIINMCINNHNNNTYVAIYPNSTGLYPPAEILTITAIKQLSKDYWQ